MGGSIFWPVNIPAIKAGDPVSADVVNRPLSALEERTNYLRTIMDNSTSGEFLYVKNVAVAENTAAGNLVSWNPTLSRYESSLAQWDSDTGSDGALKPASSAIVAGLLVLKLTPTTGCLVMGGMLRGFTELEALFGTTTPTMGAYYLSSDKAGQVTDSVPPLAILAIQYLGNGDLMIPTIRMEHSTHDHKAVLLDHTKWLSATPANFPDYDIPLTAAYGYARNEAGQEDVARLFTAYPGFAVITNSVTAASVPYADYIINRDNIWWTTTIPSAELIAWFTPANSHGPAIVRAANTNTPDRISLAMVNGMLTIDEKTRAESTEELGGLVVKEITDTEVRKGYVVERVIPGAGMYVSSSVAGGKGAVEIGLADFYGSYVDASVVNLDSALESIVDGVISIILPTGRSSSVTALAPGQTWVTGTKKVGIWVWMRGWKNGSAPLPALTVDVMVFPQTTSSGSAIPTIYSHTISGISANTTYDKYYLMETAAADRITIPTGANVQYKLSLAAASSQDQYIIRQGIRIYEA